MYLSDVDSSLTHLNQLITDFGELSGYKVNWSKSELMPLNNHCTIDCIQNTKIKWKETEIIYLGLRITPITHKTRDINLAQIMSKINNNVARWSNLPISLWGRINAVKMTVLPSLNYILRMLPLPISKNWFDSLQ